MCDEEQIAALREEIRGRVRRQITLVRLTAVWSMPILAIFAGLVVTSLRHPGWRAPWHPTGELCFGLGGLILITSGCRSLAARRSIHQLRKRFARLTSEQRQLLLPALAAGRSRSTEELVGPLLREFSGQGELTPKELRSTELAPATAPDARGDEASLVEKAL